jgi:hypothetical protein
MKLMTKQIEERFKAVGDQSEKENPLFIAKYFNPCGAGTWYASEYDPETKIFNGLVTGLACDEFGSFSLTELESVTLAFGLKIERDIHFNEISYRELVGPKPQKREAELKALKENKEPNQDRER